jgi:uncharacterized protein
MNTLPILLELQGVHDNLRTVERDLTAFPPDMARLNTELQAMARRRTEAEKVLGESRTKATELARNLVEALKLEEHSRRAVKAATTKVQYTAAIRELDERERQVHGIQKPLKDLQARVLALDAEVTELTGRHAETLAQFEELHQIFLSEHENQVEARGRLQTRRTELEVGLSPKDLHHFTKLLHARQGRAVSPVDGNICTGCRTKLRIPLMIELRERGLVLCESCQRFLHLPHKP